MKTAALLSIVLVAACASGSAPAGRTGEQTVRVVGTTGGQVAQVATSPTTGAITMTIEHPPELVWQVLPQAYKALGMEIAKADSANGIIGNPGFRARRRLGEVSLSRYVDCGTTQGGPSADSYEVHFSVLTEMVKAQRGRYVDTVLSTIVDATARPINFAGDAVRCLSRGELEKRIANAVHVLATARAGS